MRTRPGQTGISDTKRILLPALILGLFVRELFAPFTGHPFDFEIWIRLGYYVSLGNDPYVLRMNPIPGLSMPGIGVLPSIGYPPLWPFVTASIYIIYSHLGVNNRFLYYFLLKQPMIFGDILAALLIYKITLSVRSDSISAARAARFWLLCPFTIIISAIWGMFDQLALDFVLIATFFCFWTATSALSEALGIFLKAIPVLFLPVLAFMQKTRKRVVAYVTFSVLIFLSFTFIPYLFFRSWQISRLIGTGTSTTIKVGNSLNYWQIVYALSNAGKLGNAQLAFYSIMGYLWIPAILLASFYCIRKFRGTRNVEVLVIASTFVILVFYLTRVQLNEQYVIYYLGLALIRYYSEKSRLGWTFHGVWLSATAFLVGNNFFMERFLAPISSYYSMLESQLNTGPTAQLRIAIMVASAISFSVFCAMQLASEYVLISRKTSKTGLLDPLSRGARAQ